MPHLMTNQDQDWLRKKLTELYEDHRKLEDTIDSLTQSDAAMNAMAIQRLKKQKLQLKDRIHHIETLLLPDIIA
jgi:hypothetical protein